MGIAEETTRTSRRRSVKYTDPEQSSHTLILKPQPKYRPQVCGDYFQALLSLAQPHKATRGPATGC
eukprot:5181804-Pyramimonas_sp.AAC.1